jgi:hypothetical protein
MSLNSDVRKTTVAPKTVEQLDRAPRPIHTPRWLAPVAVVLLVVVAAIVGVSLLRSDDTTTTAFEPLIVPEEQVFIDARVGQFGRGTVTPAPQARTPSVVVHTRPQGVPGMLDYYELELIQAKTPFALSPSPAPVGFPTLIGPEEQAFIDGEYFNEAIEDWCLTHTPC